MKIQTSLMCIFIISLFTLHQCARTDIREMALKGDPCWRDKASCDSTCPRPRPSSP
ncbi:BnaCnng70230D [Brassica napus]|uniref:BnaCnng70230D protein n=3 Tax=Brassica TaxID=3705 RepID=A0A078JZ00_BRANA|nr:BnaCnng70230D [Brassica napus]VDD27292.1 unnamed protein product [Brassica oleracea]